MKINAQNSLGKRKKEELKQHAVCPSGKNRGPPAAPRVSRREGRAAGRAPPSSARIRAPGSPGGDAGAGRGSGRRAAVLTPGTTPTPCWSQPAREPSKAPRPPAQAPTRRRPCALHLMIYFLHFKHQDRLWGAHIPRGRRLWATVPSRPPVLWVLWARHSVGQTRQGASGPLAAGSSSAKRRWAPRAPRGARCARPAGLPCATVSR